MHLIVYLRASIYLSFQCLSTAVAISSCLFVDRTPNFLFLIFTFVFSSYLAPVAVDTLWSESGPMLSATESATAERISIAKEGEPAIVVEDRVVASPRRRKTLEATEKGGGKCREQDQGFKVGKYGFLKNHTQSRTCTSLL